MCRVSLTPQQKGKVKEQTGREMSHVDIPDVDGAIQSRMPNVSPEEVFQHALSQALALNRWENAYSRYLDELEAWRSQYGDEAAIEWEQAPQRAAVDELLGPVPESAPHGAPRRVSAVFDPDEPLSAAQTVRSMQAVPKARPGQYKASDFDELEYDEVEYDERDYRDSVSSPSIPPVSRPGQDSGVRYGQQDSGSGPQYIDEEEAPTNLELPRPLPPGSEPMLPPVNPPGSQPMLPPVNPPGSQPMLSPVNPPGSQPMLPPVNPPTLAMPGAGRGQLAPEDDLDVRSTGRFWPSSGDDRDGLPEGTGLEDAIGVGSVIEERYEIVSEIATGGHATVYKARQRLIERMIAVKVLRISLILLDDEAFEERFLREAKLAAQLNHPNVVIVHEFGFAGALRQPFIAMELLEGSDLRQELDAVGKLPPARAISLARTCLDALAVGHRRGIVHKDIKPSNLFLAQCEDLGERLKILDFGIAREHASDAPHLTATGDIVGTPQYVAPEYAKGQIVSPALDVYQVGLILVELITGERAANADSRMECLLQHTSGNLNVPRSLRRSLLGPILRKSLHKDHRRRYANAKAFRDALAEVDVPRLEKELSGKSPKEIRTPAERDKRKQVIILAMVALLLVGIWLVLIVIGLGG